MAIVLGKNGILRIYDNGGWRMYACAKDVQINKAVSTVETSTTGSGVFSTFKPQKITWSGNATGIVNLDEPGLLTIADLEQMMLSFTEILINFEMTDLDGNVYTQEGTVIITGSINSAILNDVATFSFDFQGTGPLTQAFTPTPLELSAVRRYQSTAAGDETTISIPSLANKDILEVVRDGIGNSSIILSGTPVDKEVLYEDNGDFSWMIPFAPNETYYILYQDI